MIDWTIPIVIIFLLSAFLYLIIEQILLRKWRKSFRYVIHVNGIRGKSTVSRMIDGICRRAGYRVFTKTTGTIPQYINTANQVHSIKRLGNANIREQIKMIRKAYLEKAEVLILECMAVNPGLQQLSEQLIIRADIAIITNLRQDHLEEMGSSMDEIARSLGTMIPANKQLICGEANAIWEEIALRKKTKILIADKKENSSLLTNQENVEIALAFARTVGIDEEVARQGIGSFHPDPGATKIWRKENTVFINCFSVNDPQSTLKQIELAKKEFDLPLTYILNSRSDRPSRIKQHIALLNTIKPTKVWLTGDATGFVKKRLDPAIEVKVLKDVKELTADSLLFGFGNIANCGHQIIHFFQEGEEYHG